MTKELDSCRGIIHKLANRYNRVLPENSIYEIEDLVSEGWEAYIKCKHYYNFLTVSSEFKTYFYRAVENRFRAILLKEKQWNKYDLTVYIDEKIDQIEDWLDINVSCEDDLERKCMVKEAILAIAEVSKEFAEMITEGATEELLLVARRDMRKRAHNNGSSMSDNNCNVIFKKRMLELFFGVKLKKIKKLLYNYI